MKRRISLIALVFFLIFSTVLPAARAQKTKTDVLIPLNDQTLFKIEYNPDIQEKWVKSNLGDKQVWTGNKQDVNFYQLEKTEQWERGYEYEVILKEKPGSNVFNFKIDSDNLNFYFQPPLSDEYFPKNYLVNDTHAFDENGTRSNYRPINVVNSYAVYDKVTDRKVLHIFRPKIIDSKLNEIWGTLLITKDNLQITIPQKFLDEAVYPVIIDPTFGYTTIGASTDDNPFGNIKVGWRYKNRVGDGNITQISVYGRAVSTNGSMRAGVYIANEIFPNIPTALKGSSNEVLVNTSLQWYNFTITAPVWNNTEYYLTIHRKPGFLNFRNYYDAGTHNQAVQHADTYADGLSDPFDPLGNIDFNFSRKGSIYANVEILDCPAAPTIVNITGAWIEYNASAINATVGTVDAGNLSSTLLIDGNTFNVSEVVGAPGIGISINFTGIDEDAQSIWLNIYYSYSGNLNHDFDIEFWNFDTSSWIEDSHLVDTLGFEWANATIYPLRIPIDFLSGGEVRVRLDHESAGNINHDLFIDYIKVQAFVPSAAATEETFQFFWIVIGIALMLIGIVLSKMWFDKENN
jgi:hypothetical protein